MKRVVYVVLTLILGLFGAAAYQLLAFEPVLDSRVSLTIEGPEFSEVIKIQPDQSLAIMIDDKVVYGDSENTVRPTASTIKMVLALAVIKAKPFGENQNGEQFTLTTRDLEFYRQQAEKGGSRTPIEIGVSVSLREALELLLIRSSNNMADSLVHFVFGDMASYRKYAASMLAAHDITNTTIGSDAAGLAADSTSTALDLAKIGKLVTDNSVLSTIVKQKFIYVPLVGDAPNSNHLLAEHSEIVGIKTGFTGAAGACFVMQAKISSRSVIIAIMGLDGTSSASAVNRSYEIFQEMLAIIQNQPVVKKGQVVGTISAGWLDSQIELVSEDSLSLSLWDSDDWTLAIELDKDIVGRSGKVGRLVIDTPDGQKSVKLLARQPISQPDLLYKILH